MATFQPLMKMIFHKTLARQLLCSRKYSTQLKESASGYEENFAEMIEKRRHEARKTISVEVNKKNDRALVEKACSEAGKIASMWHYTVQSTGIKHTQRDFYLVEFEEEQMVNEVMLHGEMTSRNSSRIRSPFLRLPSNEKKHTHDLNIFNNVQKKLETDLKKCTDISQQIEVYFDTVRASETDTRLKYLTCRQVEQSISGMFPYLALLPFGSSVNGFGNQSSDLDAVMSLEVKDQRSNRPNFDLFFQKGKSNKYRMPEDRTSVISYLEFITEILYMMPGVSRAKCLSRARVPIIKYTHLYTGLECDISANNWSGYCMSEMLYNYTALDRRIAPLVLAVRLWAKDSGLTCRHPGRWITNFSLTMMVLHYFMVRQGLVSLHVLQSNARPEDKRTMEDGLDCTFLRDVAKIRQLQGEQSSATLGELLQDFIEYYRDFNFRYHCLSPLTGTVLIKQSHDPLHIQNPLQPELNVSRNVTIEETHKIIEAFKTTRLTEKGQEERWGLCQFLESGDGLNLTEGAIRDMFKVDK